eukprot:TRINITY_DN458_c0_g1_i2.p1 TRINITY_DN458_c0_g1~~TRINITY_DN458_c0_g1_i2.p1  ORF type:complete len:188 (-),score=23.71 TRINITY_DN458_c0_g1_i2:185-748(-)
MPLSATLYHTFKHPWEEVTLASWRKYPSPSRPDVLAVDLIQKKYDEETGILTGQRIAYNNTQIPSWINKLFRTGNFLLFHEQFSVDQKNKVMVLKGRNLSFTNIISSEETCTYTLDPENQNWTMFKQEMKITAHPFGVGHKIESYAASTFQENSVKGREIMERAIEKIKREFYPALSSPQVEMITQE